MPGVNIGVLGGVLRCGLTPGAGCFSGCGRCGGGGNSDSCRGTRRLRRCVQGLVGLLRAGIAELVASTTTASAATATAAARAVLVRLFGAIVASERATIVLTRYARWTAVVLIGNFARLPTAFAAVFGTTAATLATAATAVTAIATTALAFTARGAFCDFGRLLGLWLDLRGGTAAEPAHQPFKEARSCFGCCRGRDGLAGRFLD